MELVVLQATAGCCLYLAVEKRFNLAIGDKVGPYLPSNPFDISGFLAIRPEFNTMWCFTHTRGVCCMLFPGTRQDACLLHLTP